MCLCKELITVPMQLFVVAQTSFPDILHLQFFDHIESCILYVIKTGGVEGLGTRLQLYPGSMTWYVCECMAWDPLMMTFYVIYRYPSSTSEQHHSRKVCELM